jgi:putative ABC transport system permease protein
VFQAKSLGDLTQLVGLAHYLGYACVGLVLALVATTTVMSVQDRIQEHAVLQTLGVTGYRVFGLVVSESTLLSVAGGLVGVAGAMLALQFSHLSVGAEAVTVAFETSWSEAVTGVAIAAIVGILAGIAPGWHAARTNIVAALRT